MAGELTETVNGVGGRTRFEYDVAGASSGGIGGGIQGAYGYYTGPRPHTVSGALGATAQGTVTGGAGGAAGHKIGQKVMAAVTVRPDAGTMAMGRSMKYRVEPYADANGMGYYKSLPDPIYDFTRKHLSKPHHVGLHVWANEKWINYQMMQGKDLVDIGAPMGPRVEGIPPMDPSPY